MRKQPRANKQALRSKVISGDTSAQENTFVANTVQADVTLEVVATIAANLAGAYVRHGGTSVARTVECLDDLSIEKIAKQAVRLAGSCSDALRQWHAQSVAGGKQLPRRYYTFDEALAVLHPKINVRQREKAHKSFLRYAIRHEQATLLKVHIEDISNPSENDVDTQLERDRGHDFSEAELGMILKDVSEWRKSEISERRRISGKKGAAARIRKGLAKKVEDLS